MNPWNRYSNKNIKDCKIGIKGNITNDSLQYYFYILENDNEDVIVVENEKKPKMYIKDKKGNDVEIQFDYLIVVKSFYVSC